MYEFKETKVVQPASDHDELELPEVRWIEAESLGDAKFSAILHTMDNWTGSDITSITSERIVIDAGPLRIRLEGFHELEEGDAQFRALELNCIRRKT
jgi:hypothetical protein